MKKYHIKEISSFDNLEEHLSVYSQLEKVVIYKNDEKEYIINGIKRINILGYENTDKIIFYDLESAYKFMLSYFDLPDSSLWKIIFFLSKQFDLETLHTLLTDYKNISSRDLWKLLQIDYNEELERYFFELNINLKEIYSYYLLSKEDIFSLMKFFMNCQANRNNRKYFFEILYELSKIKKTTITELLDLKEIKDIMNSKLQNNEKIKKIKDYLFLLRNPNTFMEIEELNNLKTKLKLPSVKLDLPIEIESSRVGVSFNFKNLKELNSKVKYLLNLASDNNFLEILNILKKR